jgi:hypothetical protein
VRHASIRQGRATAGVHERLNMAGAERHLVGDGDILEERQQIDLLLILHANEVVIGLAGERENGRVIHLRVVKAVQEMNRSGSGRRETDAEPAGVFRIAAGHEGRRLFVTDLHKADPPLSRLGTCTSSESDRCGRSSIWRRIS